MTNKKIPQLFEVKESLGPLESEVMRIIWSKDKADVREITEEIRRKKPIAYTTIMTIMDTLFKKGFLERQKVGKAYLYKTVAPRTVFLKNALASVINDLTENYGRAQVLFATLQPNTSFVKQLKTKMITVSGVSQYRVTVGYGMAFTFLTIALFYSIWELFQNFEFFGTTEYIKLVFAEPVLVFERLNLVTLAIIESLPVVNILATIVFFALLTLVGKKLNRITNRNILPRLGGLV